MEVGNVVLLFVSLVGHLMRLGGVLGDDQREAEWTLQLRVWLPFIV